MPPLLSKLWNLCDGAGLETRFSERKTTKLTGKSQLARARFLWVGHPEHVERMHKPASAEEYKLIGNFHAVRKTLRQDRFAERLDRPLAYWALPNDRRLPLAFLGRTLRD